MVVFSAGNPQSIITLGTRFSAYHLDLSTGLFLSPPQRHYKKSSGRGTSNTWDEPVHSHVAYKKKQKSEYLYRNKRLYWLEVQADPRQLEMSQYTVVWGMRKSEKASISIEKATLTRSTSRPEISKIQAHAKPASRRAGIQVNYWSNQSIFLLMRGLGPGLNNSYPISAAVSTSYFIFIQFKSHSWRRHFQTHKAKPSPRRGSWRYQSERD